MKVIKVKRADENYQEKKFGSVLVSRGSMFSKVPSHIWEIVSFEPVKFNFGKDFDMYDVEDFVKKSEKLNKDIKAALKFVEKERSKIK